MSDLLSFTVWWAVIQLLGLAVWPIGYRLFRWLPDRGYTMLKPLGLLLVSYLVWLSASLHILPNTPATIISIALLIAALSWLLALRQRSDPQGFFTQLRPWLRERLSLVITFELVFFLAFAGWALLRAYNPEVVTGEKIMANSFINAIQRSAWFPPHDPWLSGYTLPYYYFGHWMIALFSEVSSLKVGMIIPLSNALWFGLTTATAFSVVVNLVLAAGQNAKRTALVFGALGAIMLTVMGNWEAPLEVMRAADTANSPFWTWLDIRDLDENYPQPEAGQPRWPPPYAPLGWWWRASRVLHDYTPNTISPQMSLVTGKPVDAEANASDVIDEFPQFTFLLGDAHAHLLDLPFALLVIALALNIYLASRRGAVRSLLKDLPLWPLYPLTLGALSFLNSWDFPTYLLLWLILWAAGRWQARALRLWQLLRDALIVVVASIIFYLPYYTNFRPPVGGVWPNLFFGTRAAQFLVMFGPFVVIGILYGTKLAVDSIRSGQVRPIGFAAKSVAGGLGLILVAATAAATIGVITYRLSPTVQQWFDTQIAAMNERSITLSDQALTRLASPWVPLILAVLVAATLLLVYARRDDRLRQANESPSTVFVLLLFGMGLLLALAVEFAFVLDLERTRANTVFKIYYQVWVLWSLACAYGMYDLLCGPSRLLSRTLRVVTGGLITVSLALGLLYPVLAIPTRIDNPQPTLDGIEVFLREPRRAGAKDVYAVAQWINQNVSGAPVLLEGADGQPGYRTSRARLSSWTGLPIPLGWAYHEQQWRGTKTIQPQRTADVATIYSTRDSDLALAMLKRYNVEYVLVSDFERGLYPAEGLAKFDQMLPLVVRRGNAKLYRVP